MHVLCFFFRRVIRSTQLEWNQFLRKNRTFRVKRISKRIENLPDKPTSICHFLNHLFEKGLVKQQKFVQSCFYSAHPRLISHRDRNSTEANSKKQVYKVYRYTSNCCSLISLRALRSSVYRTSRVIL